MNLARFKIDWM